MIPHHHALVPCNVYQFAATQAIIEVESKQQRGTKPGQHPYARALFRHLRGGAMPITAKDVRFAIVEYIPKERGGASKSDYIAALDRLIETRGKDCPLPLSGSTVGQYFPDEHYRLSERQVRQWDLRCTRVDKIEARQRQQKLRRYQTQVAQAQIELAFTTPGELMAWYKRQERQGIYDDDLIESVHTWSQRFSGVRSEVFASGQPLWAVLNDMHDALTSRTAIEQWLDSLMLPNKVAHKY
ncbi:plasmid SOS inhibition protein A [Salmonella enterica]|nr:plasmid SOS inhibition protein A [Salmonella enterica]EEH5466743.1 plasmid SOS inhibition protein A [Salmonella enterica]EEH7556221.1 plasmid SOS inhibition protein A [Salmonella enterica]EGN2451120.1 plasmid SOS inhibition protein A [Salmonella enterica]